MDMDKGLLNDDPSVTLTIRLIMQGKVKRKTDCFDLVSFVCFVYFKKWTNKAGLETMETLQGLCNWRTGSLAWSRGIFFYFVSWFSSWLDAKPYETSTDVFISRRYLQIKAVELNTLFCIVKASESMHWLSKCQMIVVCIFRMAQGYLAQKWHRG